MYASRDRDMEYQTNNKPIWVEMARQFKYCWVKSQSLFEHQFMGDPNDYNDELGLDPIDLNYFRVCILMIIL